MEKQVRGRMLKQWDVVASLFHLALETMGSVAHEDNLTYFFPFKRPLI